MPGEGRKPGRCATWSAAPSALSEPRHVASRRVAVFEPFGDAPFGLSHRNASRSSAAMSGRARTEIALGSRAVSTSSPPPTGVGTTGVDGVVEAADGHSCRVSTHVCCGAVGDAARPVARRDAPPYDAEAARTELAAARPDPAAAVNFRLACECSHRAPSRSGPADATRQWRLLAIMAALRARGSPPPPANETIVGSVRVAHGAYEGVSS